MGTSINTLLFWVATRPHVGLRHLITYWLSDYMKKSLDCREFLSFQNFLRFPKCLEIFILSGKLNSLQIFLFLWLGLQTNTGWLLRTIKLIISLNYLNLSKVRLGWVYFELSQFLIHIHWLIIVYIKVFLINKNKF